MSRSRERPASHYATTTQPLSIRMSKTLIARIDAYAKDHCLTRAQATVLMVESGFTALTGETVPPRQQAHDFVFFEPRRREELPPVSESIKAMVKTVG